MARYTGPKNRLSRREGQDLFGRGLKLRRANVPPGQHGPKGARRQSEYGLQLREKQKAKRTYGIMERQFRRYVRMPGSLLRWLETRLDNVVYRLGFVPSRAMARQLIGHHHVLVNDRVVSVPSYQVQPGEIISLAHKALEMPVVKTRLAAAVPALPEWLKRQAAVGRVVRAPRREDIDSHIDESLVVEFYSR